MSSSPDTTTVEPREIEIRHCHSLPEYETCVDLELRIWGEQIAVPSAIFVVAHHTGGQILGAFDDDKMVGFTLALVGTRSGKPFLHSHMTAVLPAYQNQGVGRRLKLFQRQDALKRDIRLVEWTFDPLELRNAHFNLNRLGALCRKYEPNLYGVTTSPLHRGLQTDRLVAEWHLDSARVVAAIEDLVKEAVEAPAVIEMPAELERWQHEDSPEVGKVQAHVREEFTKWFAKGYAAVGLRTSPGKRAYLLAPWSDF